MKTIMFETKNTVDGINDRLHVTEETVAVSKSYYSKCRGQRGLTRHGDTRTLIFIT